MGLIVLVDSARWHQVPVNHRGDWLFVELTSADGQTGWGEASHSGNDAQTARSLSKLCEILKASELPDTGLPKSMVNALANARDDKPERTALSAFEQAIVDLQSRRLQLSVAQLLGEKNPGETVPIYTNLNRMCADRSPVTVANAGKQALLGGVTWMKFAPFDEVNVQALAEGSQAEALVEPGRQRLAALRDAVGPDVNLMIDCHWRFNPASIAVLAAVAVEFAIAWIEDPFLVLTRELSTQLREQTGALITGGEQFLQFDEFERYCQTAGVDVLIADVKHVGGIGEMDRICKLAAQHRIEFAPHNPSGPISTAASAHVCAANSNARVLEYAFGEVPWRTNFAPNERVSGALIDVSGPGLGVELDLSSAG